jgi:hypothetical protein
MALFDGDADEHAHADAVTLCDAREYRPDVHALFGRAHNRALRAQQFREIEFEGACLYAPCADDLAPRFTAELFRVLRANRGVLRATNIDGQRRRRTLWTLTRRSETIAGSAAAGDGRRIVLRREMSARDAAEALWPSADY